MLRSPIRASAIFHSPLGSGLSRILVRALRWRLGILSGRVLVAEDVGGDVVGVDPDVQAFPQVVPIRLLRHEAEPGPGVAADVDVGVNRHLRDAHLLVLVELRLEHLLADAAALALADDLEAVVVGDQIAVLVALEGPVDRAGHAALDEAV